ncbi:uncharacterized protein LOC129597534 [Paramacrobiotus metropolitanus]|uniref:uncharacterized protein LOC129597534 n=1 Tax=Paramacrobiotus metropolitanus TaxID=2943436 RepID=UPI0024462952|nr:uncharacterized protein LOC129597534 [Paramacrobiotus metropolitanus]
MTNSDLIEAHAYAKPHRNIPVDARMREASGGAWTWFPAEIVNITRGIPMTPCKATWLAVIRWGSDLQYTELVSLAQLRWRVVREWWTSTGLQPPAQSPSDAWYDQSSSLTDPNAYPEAVESGTFQKHSLPIPEDCRHVDVDKLLQRLNTFDLQPDEFIYGLVWFAGVMDARVWYILRNNKFSQEIEERHRIITRWIQIRTWMLTEEITTSPAGREEIGDADAHVLSSAVWLEVFSQLNTVMQTRLRNVCYTWNCLVDLPVLTAGIVLIYPSNGYYANHIMQLVTSWHRCLLCHSGRIDTES